MPEDKNLEVVATPEEVEADALAAVEAFWTEDKMAKARPLPLPERKGEPPAEAEFLVDGAAPVCEDEAGPEEPDDEEEELDEAAPRYRTSLVANLNVAPYKYVGKVFMTFGGRNYVGSGWCIYRRTVFTAGHCVHDKQKGWAKNVLFKGRYRAGSQAGTWALPRLAALRGWIDKEDFRYDIGAGLTRGDIQAVLGRMGWVANIPANQGTIDSIGYPASPVAGYNFDGQRMWHCLGQYLSGSNPVKMANNMTGGCSGGPWTVFFRGQSRANGLNSFRWTNEPETMNSPYFGQGFLNLVQWIKQNGGN